MKSLCEWFCNFFQIFWSKALFVEIRWKTLNFNINDNKCLCQINKSCVIIHQIYFLHLSKSTQSLPLVRQQDFLISFVLFFPSSKSNMKEKQACVPVLYIYIHETLKNVYMPNNLSLNWVEIPGKKGYKKFSKHLAFHHTQICAGTHLYG